MFINNCKIFSLFYKVNIIMSIAQRCSLYCIVLILSVNYSSQTPINRKVPMNKPITDTQFVWNATNPNTFANLRMCGPYGGFDLQPISYCSKGIVFKKLFAPTCLCPFGVWILKERLCDPVSYILIGDARRDICYTMDLKIRSIIYLGDPDDAHAPKAYVTTNTMLVFYEIPQNGSWTQVLELDDIIVISLFPKEGLVIETDEGSCFPMVEMNPFNWPVHIWSAALGPVKFRFAKKCPDEFNFGYDVLATATAPYTLTNKVPPAIPRISCESKYAECSKVPSTTIRPINPIHVSTTTERRETTPPPKKTTARTKWFDEMTFGEQEWELIANPIEVMENWEWSIFGNHYEYLDEDMSVETAKKEGYLFPNGTLNETAAFWVLNNTFSFVPQTTPKSTTPNGGDETESEATTEQIASGNLEKPKLNITDEDLSNISVGASEERRQNIDLCTAIVSQNSPDCDYSRTSFDLDHLEELIRDIQPATKGFMENKNLPYNFAVYFRNFITILEKACPTPLIPPKILALFLNVFKLIYEKSDEVYNLIPEAVHQSNLNILLDCFHDTVPFTYHFLKTCPTEVSCGTVNNNVKLDPTLPMSVAYDLTLNLTIETTWKQVLFVRYHCSRYFVMRDKIDDMNLLFSYLDRIFSEPDLVTSWYKSTETQLNALEEVIAHENTRFNFPEFGTALDACVGFGKHYAEMDDLNEYIPSIWQKWSERPKMQTFSQDHSSSENNAYESSDRASQGRSYLNNTVDFTTAENKDKDVENETKKESDVSLMSTTLSTLGDKRDAKEITETPENFNETGLEGETETAEGLTSEINPDSNLTAATENKNKSLVDKANVTKPIKLITVSQVQPNSMVKLEYPIKKESCKLSEVIVRYPPYCPIKSDDFTLDSEQKDEYSRVAEMIKEGLRKRSPSISEKYFAEASNVFQVSCRTSLVPSESISKILNVFLSLVPISQRNNYFQISEETQQSNSQILDDCVRDSNAVTFHFLNECPTKVLCAVINESEPAPYNTIIPKPIAFDLNLIDIVVEGMWKMVLLLKYKCAKHFVRKGKLNDMNELYASLNKIFIDQTVLSKWYSPSKLPDRALSQLFSIENLEAVTQIFDTCLGLWKSFSGTNPFQPSSLQDWSYRPIITKRRKRTLQLQTALVLDGSAYCMESYWDQVALYDMNAAEATCDIERLPR